ncbi:hypothetical protein [Nostoc sp.]
MNSVRVGDSGAIASLRTPAEDKLRAASVCDTLRERRERLNIG